MVIPTAVLLFMRLIYHYIIFIYGNTAAVLLFMTLIYHYIIFIYGNADCGIAFYDIYLSLYNIYLW